MTSRKIEQLEPVKTVIERAARMRGSIGDAATANVNDEQHLTGLRF